MTKKQPTSHLTFLGDPHSGRDEMNLAGHPFALLQSPKRQSETSIFYEWERTINGREVTASWRVETPAVYGLPGPEEELLYLVLLQLTREAAEAQTSPADWPHTVRFSRADVLRRMGWDDSTRRYAALDMAFNRLNAVSVSARHAFYDARIKSPAPSVGFGILSNFHLASEPKRRKNQGHLPLSHFEWDTILHTSFLAGNVRSLALNFAISLEHPTSRRLFRLLEVLRHASKPPRPQISIGLFRLRDRLGMADYKYPSKVMEKLNPGIDELSERGYLAGVDTEKAEDGSTIVLFRFAESFPAHYPIQASEAQQEALAGQGRASREQGQAPQNAAQREPQPAPQIELLRDSPLANLSLCSLLPDFTAPSPADLDPSHGALDLFFDGLPQDERDDIDARIRDGLNEVLRDNPKARGTKLEVQRGRRREVLARYPGALRDLG